MAEGWPITAKCSSIIHSLVLALPDTSGSGRCFVLGTQCKEDEDVGIVWDHVRYQGRLGLEIG